MSNLENVDGEIMEVGDIADAMDVNSDDLIDPKDLYKFQDIVSFFSGKEDKRFIINSLIMKMGGKVDAISHVWNYVQLRKEHIDVRERLEQLQKELKYYE